MGLAVFTPRSAPKEISFGTSSRRVPRPYRASPGMPPCTPMVQGRSLEVLAPAAYFGLRSPLSPGLPHPVRCAFRFSQPPSALLLRSLPALFHAGNAHGVHRPSELSPCAQPNYPFRGRMPSCHCRCKNRGWLQGFAPGAEPLAVPSVLGSGYGTCSRGLRPLQGFPLPRAAFPTSKQEGSALGLPAEQLMYYPAVPFSVLPRGKVGLTLSSLPALLRFVTFLPTPLAR